MKYFIYGSRQSRAGITLSWHIKGGNNIIVNLKLYDSYQQNVRTAPVSKQCWPLGLGVNRSQGGQHSFSSSFSKSACAYIISII